VSPSGPKGAGTGALGGLRIVLTGGPGGGKTTAADLFRRELAAQVALVPEAATLLFSGGFPRVGDAEGSRATQLAIYHVQRSLEHVVAATHAGKVLLCDRGTVDGAAYWPGGPEGFFRALDTTLEVELRRYDAVVFFQSAAVGGLEIEGGNPVRLETSRQAAELDELLRALWSHHPCYRLVPHDRSFLRKIQNGVEALQALVSELGAGV
jgi:predicted ATPase